MKQLLLFFAVFVLTFTTKAQFKNNLWQGSPFQLTGQSGAVGAGYGIQIKNSFADTAAANSSSVGGPVGFLKNIPGFIIRTVDTYWSRSNDMQKWNPLGSGTGTSYVVNLPLQIIAGTSGNPDTIFINHAGPGDDGYMSAADYNYLYSIDGSKWEVSGSGIRTKLDKTIGVGTPANSFYMADFGGNIRYTDILYDAFGPMLHHGGYNQSTYGGRNSGLNATSSAQDNTGFGESTFRNVSTASNSTAMGVSAGFSLSTGTRDVFIGRNAGVFVTTGSDNIYIGAQAGGSDNNAAGSFNIKIGSSTTLPSSTKSYQLNIGNWVYGNNGNITVGTASDSARKFNVTGTAAVSDTLFNIGNKYNGTSTALTMAVYDTLTGGYFHQPLPTPVALTNEWHLTGNAGTTLGTNFIGTTDAVSWMVKTNNTERLRLTHGASTSDQLLKLSADNLVGGIGYYVSANSLTTGQAIYVATPSITTGSAIRVDASSTGSWTNGGMMFLNASQPHTGLSFNIQDATLTGTSQSITASSLTTGTGLEVVSNSGSLNSTNGLLSVRNTNTSTSGVLARFQSNSASGSGMTILANGNVGIGVSPSYKLEVLADNGGVFAGYVYNSNSDGAGMAVAVNNVVTDRTVFQVLSGTSGGTSLFEVTADGKTKIPSLTNLSTQNRLVGQFNTNAQLGYVTLGTGGSLSSGVLSFTGTQNLFSSIPVSGQTTVTANSTTTALTFVAGTNMTITTNNTTKEITFTASGGGGGSQDLASVTSLGNTTTDDIIVDDGGSKTIKMMTTTSVATSGVEIADVNGKGTYSPGSLRWESISTGFHLDIAPTALTGSNKSILFPNASGTVALTATTLSTTLADGKFYVGNGSNIATAVTPTGDVTFDNAGVFSIGATKVTNAMLAGSIAYSKLSLTGAILNADLAGSIAYSKLSLTGAILNADLAGSIAASKLVGTDIATVGTITSGTWQGTVIGSTYGGTGINNAGRTLTISTNSGTINFSGASKTLTVPLDASVSGTNTGDQNLFSNIPVSGQTTVTASTTTTALTFVAGSNMTITTDNTTKTITFASSAIGGGLVVGVSTITGGTNTKVLYNNSGLLGEYTISGSGNVAMTTSPAFTTPSLGSATATLITIGTLGYTATNPLVTLQSSVNSFNQFIIQNTSNGASASADVVVNNDVSTNTTFYGDFGMNSSGFTGSGAFNQPSYVFLTSTSSDLAIGTTTSNGIHFVVNGGATDVITISSAGAITINGNTAFGANNITITGSIAATGSRVTKGWFTDIESTNAPTVGGVVVPTISSTNTLTNKRITARTGTTASSGTPTINTDNVDFYSITALAANITSFTTNLSGTPSTGDKLWISITDNGTPRTIAWGASFSGSLLPATTVASVNLNVGLFWNGSTWQCIAVNDFRWIFLFVFLPTLLFGRRRFKESLNSHFEKYIV